MLLGVNIDHIATIRQARGTAYPRPLDAALLAEQSGADSITIHLREDRRHIQDDDVNNIKANISIPLNLEMALTNEMLSIAISIAPAYCCIVPESREELTTEGGLNIKNNLDFISAGVARLAEANIKVSLFIDPDKEQIDAAIAAGAPCIEIHTGRFAEATTDAEAKQERQKIINAVNYSLKKGLTVNAGHGLNYDNTMDIANIKGINELNIGHSIVARALFVGLPEAVIEMKQLIQGAAE